ncbi:hypothetical protein H8K32_19185, partial [Undibacterium jejuense]
WKGYHCNHSAASANYFRTTGSLLNKSDHQSKDRSTCVDRVLTIHKSIVRDKDVKIFLNRPRVGDIISLNSNTLDYVTTRTERTETEYIVGNVTRVNVLSHFGRLFSDEEGRVVSYELANPDDQRVRGLAIKSMKENNDGNDGKVHLKVSKIVSAQGVVKRYIVHDILEIF